MTYERDVNHYLIGLVRRDLRRKLISRRAIIVKFGAAAVMTHHDEGIRWVVDRLHDLGGHITVETDNLDREMLAAALRSTAA